MISCVAIDDDVLFLKLLEAYFGELPGAELLSTHNNPVKGALAIVKEKPDVILIDFDMPYLSGLDMLSMLNIRPKTVMISSHKEQPVDSYLEVDLYISKPSLKEPEYLSWALAEVMKS